MKTTAKDLRFHIKELLETVIRGEEVEITRRGKPIARLVPIDKKEETKPEKIELFGIWQDKEDVTDVEKYVHNLRIRQRHVD